MSYGVRIKKYNFGIFSWKQVEISAKSYDDASQNYNTMRSSNLLEINIKIMIWRMFIQYVAYSLTTFFSSGSYFVDISTILVRLCESKGVAEI